VPDQAEDCVLHKVDPSAEQGADDSDNEGMRGQRVQCASH